MIKIFQHLLPTGKAWRLTIDKQLRQFFDGLTFLITDSKSYTDLVYRDLFPQDTRALDEWEAQFGLQAGTLTTQERRDRLDAVWAAEGGQTLAYLQSTLQAAGFSVFLHEWWSDTVPTARNPHDVLSDPASAGWTFGNPAYTFGNPAATFGGGGGSGYALVNKIVKTEPVFPNTFGNPAYTFGGATSTFGFFETFAPKQVLYPIPLDADTWPFFLYIGGQTYPQLAQVPASRRNEFEALCLKICPAQQWLGILVNYT